MTIRTFATKAGVGINTVYRFEGGQVVDPRVVEKMKAAFEALGVAFLEDDGFDGPGIRFRGQPSFR